MLLEVQRVYRLQGVEINDKHIEVIVRQIDVYKRQAGTISYSCSNEIRMNKDDVTKDVYHLTKVMRSNQSNCYNQKPIVFDGDHVEAGEVIADGPSAYQGELALGKNPLIGFMTCQTKRQQIHRTNQP